MADVVNAPPLNLREKVNHPIGLLYAEIYSAVVLDGCLRHGRTQPGFGLKDVAPFYVAARKAVEGGLDRSEEYLVEVIEQELACYYQMVRPGNAAVWLGLNTGAGHRLSAFPPWGAVFPWRARSQASYQKAYENAAISENDVVGTALDISQGWLFCGPVSDTKRNIEAKRIAHVLKEMDQKGYRRSDSPDGDVRATALIRKNEWRWIITAGNHRAAAASALGYDEIPIRVNLAICREHVDYWPHVVNGLFSRVQALNVFDMFFDASPPEITQGWIQHARVEMETLES